MCLHNSQKEKSSAEEGDTHQEYQTQEYTLPKMYLFVFLEHLIKSQMVP